MSLNSYIRDTKTEMKHVVWPSRSQAIKYTAAIIIVSLVLAALLGAFDSLFTYAIETLVR